MLILAKNTIHIKMKGNRYWSMASVCAAFPSMVNMLILAKKPITSVMKGNRYWSMASVFHPCFSARQASSIHEFTLTVNKGLTALLNHCKTHTSYLRFDTSTYHKKVLCSLHIG